MIPKKFAIALLSACLSAAPALCTTLVGEIEHSEHLDPVESSLSPGQVFNPGNLPKTAVQPRNNWYMIPAWLAGTWHRDQQTDYFRYWYKTGQEDIATHNLQARGDGTWGTQQDAQGNYWQYDPSPFTTTVDGGEDTIVEIIRYCEPVEVAGKRFVRRSIDTQIRVSKQNNVIKSVESGEQISSYAPEMANLIKRTTSAKVFDLQGTPVLLGKSFSYEKKVAEYSPQDNYAGQDMKTLFRQFMQQRNQQASEASAVQH